MTHVVYYVASSLDGRIAGPEDGVTFLETLEGPDDAGYAKFFGAVDSLVMGAKTWRFILRHGTWPYEARPTWVLTSEAQLAPLEGAHASPFSGEVAELLDLIERLGLRRTWLVGGGDVAGQFLAIDRLDELILTLAPTLLGQGPSLAEGSLPQRNFALDTVRRLDGTAGVTLRYLRDHSE